MNKNKNTIKLNGKNLISINNENIFLFSTNIKTSNIPLNNQILQFHHIENALTSLWNSFNELDLDLSNIIQIQFKIQSEKRLKKA